MVVDNDSGDDSLEYLENLDWIELIERKDKTNDTSGGYAHAAALDMALERCDTEFFASMHSDTFVHKDFWLSELMKYFNNSEKIACVGGGKVELTPSWKVLLKKAGDFKTFKRKLLRTPDSLGMYRYYNRTVCSIYRTDILKKEELSFLMDREKGLTVGKKLYFELVDRGYDTVKLPDRVMKKYIYHLAHATQVVNPDEFKNIKSRTRRKTNKVIKKIWNSPAVQDVLSDDSLDY
jgi:cellulose synthase/poly-beta-1,6-N-acetylglucosamine synthase-like glycosyltransferase